MYKKCTCITAASLLQADNKSAILDCIKNCLRSSIYIRQHEYNIWLLERLLECHLLDSDYILLFPSQFDRKNLHHPTVSFDKHHLLDQPA